MKVLGWERTDSWERWYAEEIVRENIEMGIKNLK